MYSDCEQRNIYFQDHPSKVEARKAELSRLESLAHHRSRRVPRATRLTFSVAPQTSLDKVASLVHDNPENLAFESYRTWLRSEVSHLSIGLPPLGHKDADQRRAVLLRRMGVMYQ